MKYLVVDNGELLLLLLLLFLLTCTVFHDDKEYPCTHALARDERNGMLMRTNLYELELFAHKVISLLLPLLSLQQQQQFSLVLVFFRA
jgi:hypothetical protein